MIVFTKSIWQISWMLYAACIRSVICNACACFASLFHQILSKAALMHLLSAQRLHTLRNRTSMTCKFLQLDWECGTDASCGLSFTPARSMYTPIITLSFVLNKHCHAHEGTNFEINEYSHPLAVEEIAQVLLFMFISTIFKCATAHAFYVRCRRITVLVPLDGHPTKEKLVATVTSRRSPASGGRRRGLHFDRFYGMRILLDTLELNLRVCVSSWKLYRSMY